MKKDILLKTGLLGMAIATLCCFTPVLVVLFGAVGLAAWIGHLDAILMPALGFFLAVTIYAFLKKDKAECCDTDRQAD